MELTTGCDVGFASDLCEVLNKLPVCRFPQVKHCFFKNCIKPIPPLPPEKRPIEYLRWSDAEAWYGTDPGYGGYNKQLPRDGDDVIIQQRK